MVRAHFLSCFFLCVAFLSSNNLVPWVSAHASEPEQYTQIRIISEKETISSGETITIGIEENIYPDWHVYWKNPGDSGEATSVKWELENGFTISDIAWPIPQKLPYGPLMNFGYENKVVLLQELTAPDTLPEGPITLKVYVDLLVCSEICIPESHSTWIRLNAPETIAYPSDIERARKLLPVEKNWDIEFYEQDAFLHLTIEGNDDPIFQELQKENASLELFVEDWGVVANGANLHISHEDGALMLKQERGEREFEAFKTFQGLLAYSNGTGQKEAISFSAKKQVKHAPGTLDGSNHTASLSIFLKAIVFAIFGGIILNLMPCVFPVLSMKALSLCKIGGEEESHAKLHGLAYTAGILISFAAIAGTLMAFKAAGEQIGWGFQLQDPSVTALLAFLLFVIGLNFAGFFEFQTGISNLGSDAAQQSGIKGSFFTGFLATLVATPCTAPFMGTAMGYALTQDILTALTIFLALGFGLALPYLLLCYIPAARNMLPKPGPWMQVFKEFLAFPMFASSAWLVWVLSQQASSESVFMTLIGMVLIAFALWMLVRGKNLEARKKWFLRLVAYTILFFGLVFPLSMFSKNKLNQAPTILSAAQQSVSSQSIAYSEQTYKQVLASDAPIFVNMTAAWCITCKINEKVTLGTKKVETLFQDHNVTYLKGDWTNRDDQITRYLNKYNREGVPLYVFYGKPDGEGIRPEPVILPQILTPQIVENTVNPS